MVLGLLHYSLQFADLRLCSLVIQLSHDRVEKVYTTESACDYGIDWVTSTRKVHLGSSPDVREDVVLPEFDQSKLGVIGMCRIVFQAVTASTLRLLVELFHIGTVELD